MSSKIEELEARLAARQAEREQKEAEQYERDLEARCSLQEEHGKVTGIRVAYTPGFPTRAYLRTPTDAEYKRYVDRIGKAVDKKNASALRKAQEELAQACWVYPLEFKDREAMLQEFPGLLTSIAIEASKLSEGKAEDEGKG